MPKSDLIPLTRIQLQYIGEIIVFHGMIAAQLDALSGLAAHAKGVPWRRSSKHGSLAEDLKRWLAQMTKVDPTDTEVLAIVGDIDAKLRVNLIERADIVHAVFGAKLPDGNFQVTGFDPGSVTGAAGMRLGKEQRFKDASELRPARDTAEHIARLMMRLHRLLASRMPGGPPLPE